MCVCVSSYDQTESLAQVRPDRAACATVQIRRASRAHRWRGRHATETRRRDTGAGRRAMVHTRHDFLRRAPEVCVVQLLRLVLVENRIEGGVLAADVEDVTKVLNFFRRADPARDELLPFTHLLRQLVLEGRDLHTNHGVT